MNRGMLTAAGSSPIALFITTPGPPIGPQRPHKHEDPHAGSKAQDKLGSRNHGL